MLCRGEKKRKTGKSMEREEEKREERREKGRKEIEREQREVSTFKKLLSRLDIARVTNNRL